MKNICLKVVPHVLIYKKISIFPRNGNASFWCQAISWSNVDKKPGLTGEVYKIK